MNKLTAFLLNIYWRFVWVPWNTFIHTDPVPIQHPCPVPQVHQGNGPPAAAFNRTFIIWSSGCFRSSGCLLVVVSGQHVILYTVLKLYEKFSLKFYFRNHRFQMSLPCWFPSITSVKGLFPVSCLYTNVMDRRTLKYCTYWFCRDIGECVEEPKVWSQHGRIAAGLGNEYYVRWNPNISNFPFLFLLKEFWTKHMGHALLQLKPSWNTRYLKKKQKKNLVLLSTGTRRGGQ